jgi:hypothetical protein
MHDLVEDISWNTQIKIEYTLGEFHVMCYLFGTSVLDKCFLKKRGGPEFGIGFIFWCSDKYSSGFEGAHVIIVVGGMSLNKQCESFFARELTSLGSHRQIRHIMFVSIFQFRYIAEPSKILTT